MNASNTDNTTYKIGEVSRLLQVEAYVLRYWESEFPQLAPLRTSRGQRLYTREDIDLLRRIKALLYEQKMTIEGARRRLEENNQWWTVISEIKSELKEIRKILQNN
ncbi:MAG: MerR family transcriptional regulator [Thermodesulfobacteriota bacterium]